MTKRLRSWLAGQSSAMGPALMGMVLSKVSSGSLQVYSYSNITASNMQTLTKTRRSIRPRSVSGSRSVESRLVLIKIPTSKADCNDSAKKSGIGVEVVVDRRIVETSPLNHPPA